MSVLKSRRKISPHEYVKCFEKLYKYTSDELSKVSKRKYPLICEPIASRMNTLYKYVMEMDNNYFFYGIKIMDSTTLPSFIIDEILKLQKSLLSLWNIERYETKKMARWADLINEEIRHFELIGALGVNESHKIFIIDNESIHKAEFVQTMSELHQLIHSKVIPLPQRTRSTYGVLLMDLADEAWFHVCRSNRFMIDSREAYERRKEDLSIALERLNQMQLPMLSLFNIMGYSESAMLQMASLLDKEIKLICAVIKSDKRRFKEYT